KIEITDIRNNMQEIASQDIDKLWDIIASSITKYAKLSLLGKKIVAGNYKATKTRESDKIKKD
ncbi:10147_t:CDS:1, partial [Scutellospora calospora]